MRRRVTLAALVLAAAGCGAQEHALSPACTDDRATIARALARAPAPVRLSDGTRLSDCLAAADTDAELQSFGVLVTGLADDLAGRGDAVRLGYLIGAAKRGSAGTNGVGAELQHRLEVAARRLASGAAAAALARGMRAGERTG
jgi:hypothetical protein